MNCSDNHSNSPKVKSKYFLGQPGMDESLSEFKEKTNSCTGPKKVEKHKTKSRKLPKRIKGQKDIRSVLKPKKNELVSYANEFDKVCKLSGVDVDSEQLQIAIALSKSLQPQDKTADSIDPHCSKSTSERRTGKIRTTLQEYGFKVPDIKITKNKKFGKQNYYKLLLTTDFEKRQIITDRYSQVLFKNVNNSITINTNSNTSHLYHICTQVTYDYLSKNTFNVENLIEASSNVIGSLLRDWSEIPGRPQSPVPEQSCITFSDFEYSQDELDRILSDRIEGAQEILQNKYQLQVKERNIQALKNNTETEANMNSNPIILEEIHIEKEARTRILEINKADNEVVQAISVPPMVRSYSPDIFDDEVSLIMNKSTGTPKDISQGTISMPIANYKSMNLTTCVTVSQKEFPENVVINTKDLLLSQSSNSLTKNNTDVMDLTECVRTGSQRSKADDIADLNTFQLSQRYDITKRKSNDLMDITECVASTSPVEVNDIVEEIDLTQKSDENSNDQTILVDVVDEKVLEQNGDYGNVDLTQSSNSEEDLPFVQISGAKKSNDDTIVLEEEEYVGMVNHENSLDVVHINTRVEVPSKESTAPNLSVGNLLANISQKSANNSCSPKCSIAIDSDDDQANDKTAENQTAEGNLARNKTESFYEKFTHDHSNDECTKQASDKNVSADHVSLDPRRSTEDCLENISCNNSFNNKDNNVNNIDLPQSSHSSEVGLRSPKSYESLGKRNNVSIDYDDMFDDVIETHTSISKEASSSLKSMISDTQEDEISNENDSNKQVSEVFDMSDKELDCSLSKSKHSRKDVASGGISVMDELSNARSSKSSSYINIQMNSYMNKTNESLPEINIGGMEKENDEAFDNNVKLSTPKGGNTEKLVIKTPMNSEYLIKIDQVTPMIDYASLSSPAINKELDKYGLKPFKRKRAIKLLTHLYHQTHPIIESRSTEAVSPSKRLKRNDSNSPTNHKETIESPKILLKSPRKFTETQTKGPSESSGVMNNPSIGCVNIFQSRKTFEEVEGIDDEGVDIYEATNDIPNIKDLGCCEDDWVLIKKKNAKVQSCSATLHQHVHNYVSARPALRARLLRLQPLNLPRLLTGLPGRPHDLMKYLDRKCITVTTGDENGKSSNRKH